MFAHHLLLAPVVGHLLALISFSVITTVNAIDPEYSLENRVDHFLAASLNTVLSALHIDKKPINEEVTFWCLNRKSPNQTQTFLNDDQLKEKINFRLPLVFIIHGWYDNRNRTWIHEMTRDYLLFQNVNICVCDWNRLALHAYAQSASNTKKVGNYLGKFIKSVNNAGMQYDRISLVGHSFGSHISGFAGAYVGGKINSIYALDPAGPRFTKKQIKPPSERLDPTDARFVQVIHTDREYIGADFDMGHQDFYPNDGASPMPGCWFPAGQTGIHPTQFLCSHFKAVEYFTASLNPNHKFIGTHCFGDFDNFMIGLCDANQRDTFGIYASRRQRGRFYLTTSDAPPFAMGFNRQKRATIETVQKIKERLLRSLGFRL